MTRSERRVAYTVDVDAMVAAMPPLTAAQKADLSLLLGPVVAELAEARAETLRKGKINDGADHRRGRRAAPVRNLAV